MIATKSMGAMNLAFAAAVDESVDPETGLRELHTLDPRPKPRSSFTRSGELLPCSLGNRVAAGVFCLRCSHFRLPPSR